MADFYAEAGYELDREQAAKGFLALLHEQRLGNAWVIEINDEPAGYLVVTVKFAMEYCGPVACLDDLYVAPPYRNRGLAADALASVRMFCEDSGIRALTVEVGIDNAPARSVYHRAGFRELPGRRLLALELAPPSHLSQSPI